MFFCDLFHLAWRLAPLLFPFTYAWALWAALRVWEVVTAYEPGWTMPPELAWPTAELAFASTTSCAFLILAFEDIDERPSYETLLLVLTLPLAGLIMCVVGVLAIPFLLVIGSQPAAFFPFVGVLVACPLWWFALQETLQ